MLHKISKYIRLMVATIIIASPAFTACTYYDDEGCDCDQYNTYIYDLAYPEDPDVVYAADLQNEDGSIVITNKYDPDLIDAENNTIEDSDPINLDSGKTSLNTNAPDADINYDDQIED